jgi:hypothetical protein
VAFRDELSHGWEIMNLSHHDLEEPFFLRAAPKSYAAIIVFCFWQILPNHGKQKFPRWQKFSFCFGF